MRMGRVAEPARCTVQKNQSLFNSTLFSYPNLLPRKKSSVAGDVCVEVRKMMQAKQMCVCFNVGKCFLGFHLCCVNKPFVKHLTPANVD